MSEQWRDKAVAVVLACALAVFFAWAVLKPADSVSLSERRELAQFPQISAQALTSGRFMEDFDSYAVDQFPLRGAFRSVYAAVSLDLMGKSDIGGLFIKDGMAASLEYPMDGQSLAHASDVFARVCDLYDVEEGSVWAAAVPDKAYFFQDDDSVLTMDYEEFFAELRRLNPQMEWIDVTDLLELSDYYATDPHWRQERIFDVAQRIAGEMGVTLPADYQQHAAVQDFRGTNAQQLSVPMAGEPLIYVDGPSLERCTVFDYQNNREIGLYDLAKAQGRDPYELFLSGSLSYVTIENPDASTDRELIVFRDSFASALAPYLAAGFAKVTLLDVRYLPSTAIPSTVDFDGADVLFLYSTSVLNNSSTLK